MFYSFNSNCVALNKRILFYKHTQLMSVQKLESCISSKMVKLELYFQDCMMLN